MRNAMWIGGGITGMGEIPMLGVKEKGIAKVIRDIFRGGEQGFFYDPNDLSTMYQDVVGIVPVTAAGQPVGLILDKSKGLQESAELNPDTQFNTPDTWSLVRSSISDGKLIFTEASTGSSASVKGITEKGKWYKITLKVDSVQGQLRASSYTPSGYTPAINFNIVAAGTYTAIIRSDEGSPDFFIRTIGASTSAVISYASIKEVKGNHAYQTTSASRPILRQNAVTGANYLEFDGTDDFLQTDVSLPFPVTAVAPFDYNSKGLIMCILSAVESGYLRSTETVASVRSTGVGISTAKKKVDVLLHEVTGDSISVRTNSDAVTSRDTDNKNPYVASKKIIGSFSETHTTLRAAMDLYGMFAIRKLLTTSEEAEIRAHFNKRMGI